MIYAIPCVDNCVSNHFSRAKQIVIFNQATQQHQLFTLTDTGTNCGKKKQWMALLQAEQVDAVVVRSIGKKMLNALFERNLRVFSAPAKADICQLEYASLLAVTSLDYGKEPKNSSGCCEAKSTRSQCSKTTKPSLFLALQQGFTRIKGIRK
ncbi:hypothetical protein VII00023_08694 [Vibrio ichthyoenteri ATCC 700023]|uniref:Dinitrogenase iron-molybdenum cofactor biosynthesis domain-containing protein n=1 Tax=Vibrio ichthyoenteri ATCC 700023 TaxID=870968 RepID=F9S7Q7_9VIBR|nr:NifB/NifX family molybdenum-iron cluster-binding protein [Vibrio ichthyoenteri]EGU31075.1 hypothetical protein VII00023_08694 [Vibrio ichthyoenteri ATCC 700023]